MKNIGKCPFCNSNEGIEWKDHGNTFIYQCCWGVDNRDVVETINSTKPPVYAKCITCKARVKIDFAINVPIDQEET